MISTFPWKRALSSRSVWFGLLVMLGFGLTAALAPWIAPQDPYKWSFSAAESSLPPAWVKNSYRSGQAAHPLGTDYYGRDILSRLIYGARTAFLLAIIAVPLTALLGTLVGLLAGYAGGRVDALFMLFTDMIQALPGLLFMVLIILIFRGIFKPSWFHGMIILVVGFSAVSWVSLARLVRINVMLLKSKLFVEAAVGLGASAWEVAIRHLLPNVLHVILAWVINNVPAVILLEALLGYIGVGITGAVEGGEFSVVSWGGLFYSGRMAMSHNPFMLIMPSLCLLLISMSFILLGDFLNEISRQEPG